MIESYLRPAYQKFLVDPVVLRIQRHTRWTPTGITLVAVLSGILSALFLYLRDPIVASFFLILSGYLDTLDGTLARVLKQSSDRGAVMDIVADRVVEFAVILGLYSVAPVSRAFPALWMLGSTLICVTSFLVVGIFLANTGKKSFHYSVGIMERAEAFAFFLVMILKPSWFVWLAWLYSLLVLATAVIRVYQFLQMKDDVEGS